MRLGGVDATRRERDLDLVAGLLGRVLDARGAASTIRSAIETCLPSEHAAVEVLLDALQG
jgi:hypothetical protein